MNDFKKIAKELENKIKKIPINRKELQKALDLLFYNILFPVCEDNACRTEDKLQDVYHILIKNTQRLIPQQESEKKIQEFIHSLSNIQTGLYKEAENFYKSDPAARNVEEVIGTYPGFFALSVYRISHKLFELEIPIIPRFFSEYAHSKVGIDIHPGTEIGNNFFIDHGTGIVIGETTTIGNNVKIYQGVTLGALSVSKEMSNIKRHPTIEDNVVIYSGATILGGNTVIGHDSVIGGNVWITESLLPYSVIYYDGHKMQIRNKNDFKNPDMFYI